MDEATLSKWREMAQNRLSKALLELFELDIPTVVVWDTLDLAARIHKKGLMEIATREGGESHMTKLISDLETVNETMAEIEGKRYIEKDISDTFGEPT